LPRKGWSKVLTTRERALEQRYGEKQAPKDNGKGASSDRFNPDHRELALNPNRFSTPARSRYAAMGTIPGRAVAVPRPRLKTTLLGVNRDDARSGADGCGRPASCCRGDGFHVHGHADEAVRQCKAIEEPDAISILQDMIGRSVDCGPRAPKCADRHIECPGTVFSAVSRS